MNPRVVTTVLSQLGTSLLFLYERSREQLTQELTIRAQAPQRSPRCRLTCRKTQSPVLVASAMALSATGPCPCPSEMAATRSSIIRSRVNAMNSPIGSVPWLSTKMSGVYRSMLGNLRRSWQMGLRPMAFGNTKHSDTQQSGFYYPGCQVGSEDSSKETRFAQGRPTQNHWKN